MKPTLKVIPNEKTKVLIVDDNPQILELFSALLQTAGYEVEQAEHALAAVAAVVRAAPDIILADIRMPIVDGMGLVQELKAHADSRHIPVVAVTGYDSPETHAAAIKAGYDGYLTKPIDPARFPAQIQAILKKYQSKKSPPSA
jgi:two-component system, cell cycle response regulator DivK